MLEVNKNSLVEDKNFSKFEITENFTCIRFLDQNKERFELEFNLEQGTSFNTFLIRNNEELVVIHPPEKSYLNSLNKCYQDYRETYPFLKKFITKVDLGYFNIQKYLPGGHFAELHSERTSLQNLHRLFAWMTYLNDVDDGGTTDFDYFDIKVKPEKGKTLIWPAEWTHAHTGSILKSGKKYIITGWMHFGI